MTRTEVVVAAFVHWLLNHLKRVYPDKVLLNPVAVTAVDRSQHLFIEIHSQLLTSV
jgi:hypothetical protein